MSPYDDFAGFDLDRIVKDADKKAEEAKHAEAGKKDEAEKPRKEPKKPKPVYVPPAPLVTPAPPEPTAPKSRFGIEYHSSILGGVWEIRGIGFSEQFDYCLTNKTISVPPAVNLVYLNSNTEWERLAVANPQSAKPMPASMLLHYDFFRSLYKNKDGDNKRGVNDIKLFLSRELERSWVSTLTRIEYNSPKPDKITHTNTLTDHVKVYDTDIGAPDCVIGSKCSARDKTACEVLLGASNTQEVYDVFKWLTGYEPVLQRHPSKVSLDRTAYLMMHTENRNLRILAMAAPETCGTAFGFLKMQPT